MFRSAIIVNVCDMERYVWGVHEERMQSEDNQRNSTGAAESLAHSQRITLTNKLKQCSLTIN